MLERSGCSLQALYLRNFVPTTDKFVECLNVLPTLKSLYISTVDFYSLMHTEKYGVEDMHQDWCVILAALSCGTIPSYDLGVADVHRPEPLYLPVLQNLEVHGIPPRPFPWDLLCRFLYSRGPLLKDPSYFLPEECVPSLKHRNFRWTVKGMGRPTDRISDGAVVRIRERVVDGLTIDVTHKDRHKF